MPGSSPKRLLPHLSEGQPAPRPSFCSHFIFRFCFFYFCFFPCLSCAKYSKHRQRLFLDQVELCLSFIVSPPFSVPDNVGRNHRTHAAGWLAHGRGARRVYPPASWEGRLAMKMFILFDQVISPLGLCSKETPEPKTKGNTETLREVRLLL